MVDDNNIVKDETVAVDKAEPEVVKEQVKPDVVEEPKKPEDTTKPEPEQDAEPKADALEYGEYENPALRQAVNLLKEAKIPVEETNAIFKEAVDSGDLSKINRSVLEAKLGKDKAEMVLVLAESYYKENFTKFKEAEKAAHEQVGGAETFKAMQEWVKQQTDPSVLSEIAEIRALMNTNKPKAIKAAIKEWYDLYKADPKTTTKANLVEGDKAPSSSDVEMLTRKQYAAEVLKAQKNGTYAKVHASLWARRQAAMKQGK